MTMILAFVVASCGNKGVNPEVKDCTETLNKLSGYMEKGDKMSEAEAMEMISVFSQLAKYNDSDVALNNADRDAIRSSINKLLDATSKVTGEAVPADLKNQVAEELKEINTLGELATQFFNGLISGL